MTRRRLLVILIIIYMILMYIVGVNLASPQAEAASTTVPLGSRSYVLHTPTGAALSALESPQGADLLVALHGYANTPQQLETTSNFDALADQYGSIVVYPLGINGTWNAGPNSPGDPTTDDVAFIRNVIADVRSHFNISPTNVRVAGFSTGAAMAFRAGCEIEDIQAIGVVSGWLSVPCTLHDIGVIHIHGFLDTTIPMDGSVGFQGRQYPPTYREAYRVTRNSVWSLLPFKGGHVWPGWAGNVLMDFFTRDYPNV